VRAPQAVRKIIYAIIFIEILTLLPTGQDLGLVFHDSIPARVLARTNHAKKKEGDYKPFLNFAVFTISL